MHVFSELKTVIKFRARSRKFQLKFDLADADFIQLVNNVFEMRFAFLIDELLFSFFILFSSFFLFDKNQNNFIKKNR